MDGTVNALLIVLIVAATCAAAAATWAFVRMGRAAASAERLAVDAHDRVGPLADSAQELLDSASVTVDAANAELLRVDAMVTRAEDAVIRFDSASNTVSDVVRSPGAFISGVAERIRRRGAEKSTAGQTSGADVSAAASAEAEGAVVFEEDADAGAPSAGEDPTDSSNGGGAVPTEAAPRRSGEPAEIVAETD